MYCYVVNPEWTFRYDFSGFYFIESFRIEAGKMWVVSTLLYIMVLTAELLWSWRAFLVPIIGVSCLPFTTFLSNLDGGMKLEEWYTFNKSEMTLACRGLRMGYMPMVSYSRARVYHWDWSKKQNKKWNFYKWIFIANKSFGLWSVCKLQLSCSLH